LKYILYNHNFYSH